MQPGWQVILLGVLSLYGFVGVGAEGGNLLENPSFEAVDAQTGLPTNWHTGVRLGKTDKGRALGCRFVTSREAQEGNAAAEISAQERDKNESLAEFSQLVSAKPMTSYYFRIYIQVPAFMSGWAGAALEELNAQRNYYPVPRAPVAGPWVFSAPVKSPDRYVLYEKVLTTGPQTHFLNISLGFYRPVSGSIRFDHALLIELPAIDRN